jgi:putative mRNA 3-end processing factor
MPHPDTWLRVLPTGLYCEPGGFHVDPTRPVDRAVITHAHSDHARPGHGAVLASAETLALMDVLGSAQVAMEWRGSRVVVSGDYKREADPTCRPFVPIPCDVFVTEATFALPVFRHPPADDEVAKLLASVALFPGRTHVVGAYALGKAQRVIALLRRAGWGQPIYVHGATAAVCGAYERLGIPLGDLRPATVAAKAEMQGGIVVAPPSAIADRWARRFADPVSCMASGWMQVRQRARMKGVELPLVISVISELVGVL